MTTLHSALKRNDRMSMFVEPTTEAYRSTTSDFACKMAGWILEDPHAPLQEGAEPPMPRMAGDGNIRVAGHEQSDIQPAFGGITDQRDCGPPGDEVCRGHPEGLTGRSHQ